MVVNTRVRSLSNPSCALSKAERGREEKPEETRVPLRLASGCRSGDVKATFQGRRCVYMLSVISVAPVWPTPPVPFTGTRRARRKD